MSRKEFTDRYLSKFISRKLLVFVVGSIGLFSGFVVSGDWVIVATVYIGSEAATNIVERLLKLKSDSGFSSTTTGNGVNLE